METKDFVLQYNNIFSKRVLNKILRETDSIVKVDSQFDRGFYCNKHIAIFAKNIGIIYARTDYIDKDFEESKIKKWKVINGSSYYYPYNTRGNYWIYDIAATKPPDQISIN